MSDWAELCITTWVLITMKLSKFLCRTQQGRQREPSIKTLRSPFSAEFWRHCVLSGGTQRRNENINIINNSFPRVVIEPITSLFYSHTLFPAPRLAEITGRHNWSRKLLDYFCNNFFFKFFKGMKWKYFLISYCSNLETQCWDTLPPLSYYRSSLTANC